MQSRLSSLKSLIGLGNRGVGSFCNRLGVRWHFFLHSESAIWSILVIDQAENVNLPKNKPAETHHSKCSLKKERKRKEVC